MNESQQLTNEQLKSLPKDLLIQLYQTLLSNYQTLSKQNEELSKSLEEIKLSLAIQKQARFGRKTEKTSEIPGQMTIDFEKMCVINESELLVEANGSKEPTMEETVKSYTRKKSAGKREADLSGIPVKDIPAIELSESELNDLFPNGYKRLDDEHFDELVMHPATFEIKRTHVAVYVSKPDENGEVEFVRGPKPGKLFGSNSICSPSLWAGIVNGKYGNANPLNRLCNAFLQHDVKLLPQDLAGWCIKGADRYMKPLWNLMRLEMIQYSRLIHSDESFFKVTDEMKKRGPNAKCFMWLYHTDTQYGSHPIFLYDYCKTRATYNPEEFLSDYKGILVTDGYEVYHSLERRHPEQFTVAGCWSHARRKFVAVLKGMGEAAAEGSVAANVVGRINAIYHMDNKYKEFSEEKRLKMRQTNVKPLVDALFEYLTTVNCIDKSSDTKKAIDYCLHQETYLRAFLDSGIIPLDNNDAERSIRMFCVNRANWHIINSNKGAEASGILLSMTETAKANGLKVFEYLTYVLESMIADSETRHEKANQRTWSDEFLKTLLPWSDTIPESCKMTKTK